MRDKFSWIGRVFENSRLEVDGMVFERCKFKHCRLVFSAIDTVTFKECSFDSCDWVFDGPAENTLLYLSALYRGLGEGGRDLVESMFERIRAGNVGGDLVEDEQDLEAVVTR